jgi:hypothetical protein
MATSPTQPGVTHEAAERSVVLDHQVEFPKALGIGNEVNADDLPTVTSLRHVSSYC